MWCCFGSKTHSQEIKKTLDSASERSPYVFTDNCFQPKTVIDCAKLSYSDWSIADVRVGRTPTAILARDFGFSEPG
jgi:hypothetical protein